MRLEKIKERLRVSRLREPISIGRVIRQSVADIRAGVMALLLAVASAAMSPTFAMDMTVESHTVVMSGAVVGSECESLKTILSANDIKVIILTDSNGGDARAGYCVGSLIRERGLSTVIRGRCASSCSRMWLGGVERTLDGPGSRVGLHGNYNNGGGLLAGAPQQLRAWIPQYAPAVDKQLMEQWINLPVNKWMMYFYNEKVELCEGRSCTLLSGRTARNSGLSTR